MIYPKNEGTYNYYDWLTKTSSCSQLLLSIMIYPKNEGTYNYYDWLTKA